MNTFRCESGEAWVFWGPSRGLLWKHACALDGFGRRAVILRGAIVGLERTGNGSQILAEITSC